MNFAETKRYNKVMNEVASFIAKFNLKDNEECEHLILALVNGVVAIQYANGILLEMDGPDAKMTLRELKVKL